MNAARPRRRTVLPRGARAILLACLLALGACQADGGGEAEVAAPVQAARPPLPRRTGPRLPAFSGGDPLRRGWVQVDGLLWIEQAHAEAYAAGHVFDGAGFAPVARPLPPGTPAERGYRMRTDHVALLTNTTWAQAQTVAREAEAHVRRLVGEHGEALDLRLPQGPLTVVIHARRAGFEATLAGRVSPSVAWGAFYDARSGRVHVSLEPAARGALPWQADLRHEMTHQILDLSRPLSRRGGAFPTPWFWLWEGIALWSEDLGGRLTDARARRFDRRRARGEVAPLEALVQLQPWQFEGRHYDQTASLMAYLMAPGRPAQRAGVLALVRELLRGEPPPGALEARLGMDLPALEVAWRDALAGL